MKLRFRRHAQLFRFNGAAIVRSRKVETSPHPIPLRPRFNGAAIVRSRKAPVDPPCQRPDYSFNGAAIVRSRKARSSNMLNSNVLADGMRAGQESSGNRGMALPRDRGISYLNLSYSTGASGSGGFGMTSPLACARCQGARGKSTGIRPHSKLRRTWSRLCPERL